MTTDILTISTAPSVSSTRWSREIITWEDLRSRVESPEYQKDCGGYVAGELRGSRRRKGEVLRRTAITLDADSARDSFPVDVASLGLRALLHSTWSHAPSQPRYRLIIPVAGQGLTEEEYPRVAQGLIEALGESQFDPGSLQPERLMFWPSTQDPDTYEWVEYEGETLTAESLLTVYGGRDSTPESTPGPKRDPLSLPGVPGAFNRRYDFARAVEEFGLPYRHIEGDRWHYIPSDSTPGVIAYPDGLVYSNHASDPCYGRALSVFDVVAMHRYAREDKDVSLSTAPMDRPSVQRALQEFASDREVLEEMAAEDFGAVEEDWVLGLQRSPKTGKTLDCVENWDLISAKDPVLQGLARNLLTSSTVTRQDLPWRRVQEGITDTLTSADRAEINAHLQRAYHLPRPSSEQVNAVIDSVAQRQEWHPVQAYLEGLEWDGAPRLETSLPTSRDDEYTRMVARLVLVGAVARALSPGCKVDHSLIIRGGEGVGKTLWVERMSRGWTSTLGPIGSKDTILSLMRSWIVVADEGVSMRKSDNDALKEFITRTHDVVRRPYDREVVSVPRRQVIWATTNDQIMLQAQEGNRRYLVIEADQAVDIESLTPDYIDQVWAEAVHRYREGERLWMTSEENQIAAQERYRYTEEYTVEGEILEYLDMLVPDDWDDMFPEEKSTWVESYRQGMVEGTQPLRTTCSREVWQVALGRPPSGYTRQDLLQITSVLKSTPQWTGPHPPLRVKGLGPQRIFRRTTDEEPLI